MAVICDEVYLNVFSGSMFRSLAPIPFVMVGIKLYSHLPRPIIYELFLDISKSANVCVNLLAQARLLRKQILVYYIVPAVGSSSG